MTLWNGSTSENACVVLRIRFDELLDQFSCV